MTSELRPAEAVWRDANTAFDRKWYELRGSEDRVEPSHSAAATVIEADREAVRAEVVGEIVAWLREDGGAEYYDGTTIATDIEAKFGGSDAGRSA